MVLQHQKPLTTTKPRSLIMTTNIIPTEAVNKLNIAESRLQMLFDLMEAKIDTSEGSLTIDQESVEGVLQNIIDSVVEILDAIA
jgi:hypothetical protein